MNVVHITESHEARAGGIPVVVDQLARYAAHAGWSVEILSVGHDPMRPPPGVNLTNVPPAWVDGLWRWSPDLRDKVFSVASRKGRRLLHVHGVWLASQWYGARAAQKTGVPFVLSSHGQLEPYHWKDKGTLHFAKKKLYWQFIAYPAFRRASVIHAITPLEKEHLGELFPDQRIELVPNAVDLDEVDKAWRSNPRLVTGRRDPIVGFLGRLHPKKGVDLLVEAFSIAGLPSEWRLLLAGPPGEPSYMRRLARLIETSGSRRRIELVGPLMDSKKWDFYRSAAVVAVPSLSEVVGLVNLEAAACGTPTITTHNTGLYDWEDGGGMLINPDVRELADALHTMCSLGRTEFETRSGASRRLVEDRYSWRAVGRRWLEVYDSLV